MREGIVLSQQKEERDWRGEAKNLKLASSSRDALIAPKKKKKREVDTRWQDVRDADDKGDDDWWGSRVERGGKVCLEARKESDEKHSHSVSAVGAAFVFFHRASSRTTHWDVCL